MALAERLNEPPRPKNGTPCSVGTLIGQLKGAELDALLTMLGTSEERGWPQDAIYDALTDEGYAVGRQSINRHRGGKCRCAKAAA